MRHTRQPLTARSATRVALYTVVAALAATVLVVAGPAGAADPVTVVGHRGITWKDNARTRENSPYALRKLARGDWMETDVRTIADRDGNPGAGWLVLAHDPTTTRTMTAESRAGKPEHWSDLTPRQFLDLRYNGGGRPKTVKRMFTIAARRGITMLVELKATDRGRALPAMAAAVNSTGANVIWYTEPNRFRDCTSPTLNRLRTEFGQQIGLKWTPGCPLTIREAAATGAVLHSRYEVTAAQVRTAKRLGMTLLSRGARPWPEVLAGGSHILTGTPVWLRRKLNRTGR